MAPPWGNIQQRTDGEEGHECIVRSKFKDKLSNFMLKKDLNAKELGEMLNQQRSEMHNQFSQILATFGKSRTPTPKPNAPTLAITTRSGTTTRDPPYLISPSSTPADNARKTIKSENTNEGEAPTTQIPKDLESPTLYHPSKSSSVPFPSWFKKQKRSMRMSDSCNGISKKKDKTTPKRKPENTEIRVKEK
ncbi:hypothetical protein Tco_0530811 [Tanacetum coccineum]